MGGMYDLERQTHEEPREGLSQAIWRFLPSTCSRTHHIPEGCHLARGLSSCVIHRTEVFFRVDVMSFR
jgi:hypothetical protein